MLLVAIAIHLSGTHEELRLVQRLSIGGARGVSLLQFVSQLCLNASLLLPLQTCVTRLGFWELYLVRAGGFLAGSLVPVAGGLAVRLAYLRNRGPDVSGFHLGDAAEQRARARRRGRASRSRDRRALDGGGPAAGRRPRRLRGRAGGERGGDRGLRTAPAPARATRAPTLAVAVGDAQPAGEPRHGNLGVRALAAASLPQLRDLRIADQSLSGGAGDFLAGGLDLRADQSDQDGQHHAGKSRRRRMGRRARRQDARLDVTTGLDRRPRVQGRRAGRPGPRRVVSGGLAAPFDKRRQQYDYRTHENPRPSCVAEGQSRGRAAALGAAFALRELQPRVLDLAGFPAQPAAETAEVLELADRYLPEPFLWYWKLAPAIVGRTCFEPWWRRRRTALFSRYDAIVCAPGPYLADYDARATSALCDIAIAARARTAGRAVEPLHRSAVSQQGSPLSRRRPRASRARLRRIEYLRERGISSVLSADLAFLYPYAADARRLMARASVSSGLPALEQSGASALRLESGALFEGLAADCGGLERPVVLATSDYRRDERFLAKAARRLGVPWVACRSVPELVRLVAALVGGRLGPLSSGDLRGGARQAGARAARTASRTRCRG